MAMTDLSKFKNLQGTGFDSDTSADSDTGDNFVDGNETLVGRLRRAMNIIRTHARETLANCESDEACRTTTDNMESSTLKMMRQERECRAISDICVSIVDDVSEDLDEIEEHESGGKGDGEEVQSIGDDPFWANTTLTRPSLPSLEVVMLTRAKMSEMLDQRLKSLNESCSDEELKLEPNYVALQKEISLGRDDFEQKQGLDSPTPSSSEQSDDDDEANEKVAKILRLLSIAEENVRSKGNQNDFDLGDESGGD